MPKPDGTLYWYEKERLQPKVEPKKAKRHIASRSARTEKLSKPVGVTKARQSAKHAEVSSQEPASVCDNADSSNVVSINGGEPIKKKSGPKPGQSTHPLMPKKGGRPKVRVKATPELIEAVCASIRKGLSIESSCILQGITRSGVDKWRKLNPAVNAQFEKAEIEFEEDLVGRMNGFAVADNKAAAWLLERRMSNRWAPVSKSELTGKNGKDLPALTVHKTLLGSMSTVDTVPKKLERSA